MSRTRIKICGITQPKDAETVVAAGADALGLVFYPPSPRHISLDAAAEIIQLLPPFVSSVALFVDAAPAEVRRLIDVIDIDLLQFHGNESADYAEQFARPYIKAVRVGGPRTVEEQLAEHSRARGFLYDTYDADAAGGTGKTFAWENFNARTRGGVLAGGLHAGNVHQALLQTGARAVDVSSGVESKPGIKDAAKVEEFIQACRSADEKRVGESGER